MKQAEDMEASHQKMVRILINFGLEFFMALNKSMAEIRINSMNSINCSLLGYNIIVSTLVGEIVRGGEDFFAARARGTGTTMG